MENPAEQKNTLENLAFTELLAPMMDTLKKLKVQFNKEEEQSETTTEDVQSKSEDTQDPEEELSIRIFSDLAEAQNILANCYARFLEKSRRN